MIHPDQPLKRAWDLLVAGLTIVNSLVIPVYVVYPHLTGWATYYSLIVSMLYMADIVFEFRTGYVSSGTFVDDGRTLAKRYLKKGFVTDLLAVLPGVFLHSMGLVRGQLAVILLFLPLLRLLKVNSTIRRVGEALINPAIFRLLMLVFWILMAAHVFSCVWIVVSGNPTELAPFDRYVRAFYWTMTTLTTIGYGDITPQTTNQTLYVIVIEMFGAAMYGLVIGNIAGLIANIDVAKSQYRDKLDRINAFLRYRAMPDQLTKKINDYYGYLWDTRKGYDEIEFLHDLPVALKEAVALHLNKDIITRVPVFEKAEPALIRDIILELQPVVFTPGDAIVRAGEMGSQMYFISKGSVVVLSPDETVTFATLTAGQFFGEISLLLSMPRTATIRATAFCDLYMLEKDAFEKVIEAYPTFKESIRIMAEKRKLEVEAMRKQREEELAKKKLEEEGKPAR